MRVKIIDLIKKDKCLSTADGFQVFEHILPVYKNLQPNEHIELDFSGVKRLITAFLNAAYGQLYGIDDENSIDKKVKLVNIPEGQQYKFDDVRENAIIYYKNKDKIDAMECDES